MKEKYVPSILTVRPLDLESAKADLRKEMTAAEARAIAEAAFAETKGNADEQNNRNA